MGCSGSAKMVPGTQVPDSGFNRSVIRAVEKYRLSVERQDTAALVLMASPRYWEDGGTATGKDDYGYKQLREVLSGRFQRSEDIRYSVRYMQIRERCPPNAQDRHGCVAFVNVLIDASYTIRDARNKKTRLDKRDQNQFVLEWDANRKRWRFLSGM